MARRQFSELGISSMLHSFHFRSCVRVDGCIHNNSDTHAIQNVDRATTSEGMFHLC